MAESAAVALKAGCDLSCMCTYDHLGEAVKRGLIAEADIDRALERTLGTRFKLGLFDPPASVPYAAIPMSVVGCEAHRRLAYEAALKSVVLLKNRKGVLPIDPQTRSITVVGPNAAAVNVLLGNYYGFNEQMITLLEGLTDALPEGMGMEYHPGVMLTEQSNLANWSINMAEPGRPDHRRHGDFTADGRRRGRSPAGGRRRRPDRDRAARGAGRSTSSASRSPARRVVLVLFGGSPVALGEVADMVEAVVQVWYPGEEGGHAVADVLFGKAVPSGKLPITFPKATSQLPPFEDYSMAERTYRYATWEPLYPFGFGLSYTRFAYSGLKLAQPDASKPAKTSISR